MDNGTGWIVSYLILNYAFASKCQEKKIEN